MADKASDLRERCAAGIRAARALGDAYNNRGAADAARAVLRDDPDHVEAHYLLGLYLHNLGRHADAVAACSAAVALAPENDIAHRLLGIALGATPATRYTALTHLDEAVRLDPADAHNHLHRAWLLACLNRHKDALKAYEAACERAPADATVLAGAAHYFFSQRQRRRARELAARAFAAAPDDLAALTVEARSRLLAGRAADARDLARAAVALLPTHYRAVAVLVEAEMCRNPLFAIWSRLKNWCSGGRWRGTILLIGGSQAVVPVFVALAMTCPGCDTAAPLAFVGCVMLVVWPGILFRRRVDGALRPARLRRGF